jgi:hypothetical protein
MGLKLQISISGSAGVDAAKNVSVVNTGNPNYVGFEFSV